MTNEIPQVLKAIEPQEGEVWLWQPELLHAREVLIVRGTVWNGEELWVRSSSLERKVITWHDTKEDSVLNPFSHWIHSAIFLAESLDELNNGR